MYQNYPQNTSYQQQILTGYPAFDNIPAYQKYDHLSPQSLGQNTSILVTYSNLPSTLRQNEIQKIDFALNTQFSCYICWVWFSFICICIGGLSYIIVGNEFENIGLYITMVLNYLLGFAAFIFGMMSIREKSSQKNDLFKKLLLLNIGIYIIALIWDLVATSTSACTYTDTEYNEENNESIETTYNCNNNLPFILINFLMCGIVYYNSSAYGRALKERERLLNEF